MEWRHGAERGVRLRWNGDMEWREELDYDGIAIWSRERTAAPDEL